MANAQGTRAAAILITLAAVLVAGGCSTDDDAGGPPPLTPALYTQSMSDICATTTGRLDALPTPPDEISRADWAGEVSHALRDEAAAFDAIDVGSSLRDDHGSLVANTEDQASQWSALGEALATDAETGTADDATISDLVTAIGELTLGRNELAAQMGLSGCQARDLS